MRNCQSCGKPPWALKSKNTGQSMVICMTPGCKYNSKPFSLEQWQDPQPISDLVNHLQAVMKPFADCVFDDNGDVTVTTSRLSALDYLQIKRALELIPQILVETERWDKGVNLSECGIAAGEVIRDALESKARPVRDVAKAVLDKAGIRYYND